MAREEYSAEALEAICDGCSGGVSWLHKRLFGRDIACAYCCDEHDVAYFEGGGAADRADADRRLRECIKDSGRPFRAWLFWLAVRAFGWFYWNEEA